MTFSILLWVLSACTQHRPSISQAPQPWTEIQELPLKGPLALQSSEVSGLDWYGDWLVFLVQHPEWFGTEEYPGLLYAVTRAQLEQAIEEGGALDPFEITFESRGLEHMIPGFEGYEAIVFEGDQVWLTIESEVEPNLRGFVVQGTMDASERILTLDPDSLIEIPMPHHVPNMTFETLLKTPDGWLAMHEVNGVQNIKKPKAYSGQSEQDHIVSMPMPNIEYRLTDATRLDAKNRFWVSNVLYPGHIGDLTLGEDLWTQQMLDRPTLEHQIPVDRLIELQYTPDGILPTETPSIVLKQDFEEGSRKWEGVVRWKGEGFLVVTDEYPRTTFALVRLP